MLTPFYLLIIVSTNGSLPASKLLEIEATNFEACQAMATHVEKPLDTVWYKATVTCIPKVAK
jgi:hypothetical protein